MKKSLLFFGLALMLSAPAIAQEKVQWQTSKAEAMKAEGLNAKMAPVAAVDRVERVGTAAKARAPRRVIADDVWYKRPEGTMYVSGSGYIYPFIPAFIDAKFPNMAADKANAKWTLVSSSNTYSVTGNADNDLELTIPKIDNGYISSLYIPHLTVGDVEYKIGDEFNLMSESSYQNPDVALINGDSLLWSVTQVNRHGGFWTGFSNGYVFGSDVRTFQAEDGSTFDGKVNAIYEFFEKPVKPLYISSIYLYAVTTAETMIPEGKEMKLSFYKAEDGQIGDLIDEIAFDMNDTVYYSKNESYDGDAEPYQAYSLFEVAKTEVDWLGTEIQMPVILNDEFCIIISGFEQEGVEWSLYMCDVLNTETDSYEKTGRIIPTLRSFVRVDDGTPIQGLRYCQYIDSETSKMYNEEDGDNYDWTRQYNAGILLNCMYDVISVYPDFQTMTAPVEGGNIYSEIETVEEDDDGNEVTNVYRYETIQYQTTLPRISTWEGTAGDENYYFEDLPDWLEVTEYIDKYYNNDNDYTTLAVVNAQPLPEGMDGRVAQIRIVSERGGDSGYITVVQGEAGNSIATVTRESARKANAKIYSLTGQQVNGNFHGIVVKNGKKVFND